MNRKWYFLALFIANMVTGGMVNAVSKTGDKPAMVVVLILTMIIVGIPVTYRLRNIGHTTKQALTFYAVTSVLVVAMAVFGFNSITWLVSLPLGLYCLFARPGLRHESA